MPASDYDPSPQLALGHTSPASPAVTIAEILLIFRRGWRFPLLGCLIGLAAASAYIYVTPALYKSTAQILIDRSVNRFFTANKVIDEPAFDDAEAYSQVYVLSSESIILPIIRSMDLLHDPEFSSGIRDSSAQDSWVGRLKSSVKSLLGWRSDPGVEPEVARERIVVERFVKQLTIERESGAVINVTFASEDSKKAAQIANAIVDSYLAATSEAKSKSTKVASQLLQDRLIEIKQSLLAANRALEDYKLRHNIVNRGSGVTPGEQLQPLSAQLATAKMQLAEAKVRIERIQQQRKSDASLGPIFPDNQLIVGLRQKYLDLSSRAAELTARVGVDHAAVVKVRKEMDEASAAIREEEKRLAESYLSAYQTAESQNNELAAMMARLSEEAKTESQAQVTLRQLEGTADSLRDTYNGVLEKFNTMNVQPSNPIPDARIITRASPQLHKSAKKFQAMLGGGLLLGLLLGAGGAVARERVAGVFRTPLQVKQVTNISCVGVPVIDSSVQPTASKQAIVEEFVLDAPHSQFAEAFRRIKVLADSAKRAYGDKIIAITSPVAKNGKSTTAMNLATLMAASARTLVIDADLHRHQLTARFEPDARGGLIEALKDPSLLTSLVLKRPRSELDFLPCVLQARIPNAAELLGSSQMERLLSAAAEIYDYIVIECPPVMSVVDVKMMERFIDKFVFVIEWGQTKQRVAVEALDEIDVTRERILCVVLNKVDPAALRMIEAYKGPQYESYYQA